MFPRNFTCNRDPLPSHLCISHSARCFNTHTPPPPPLLLVKSFAWRLKPPSPSASNSSFRSAFPVLFLLVWHIAAMNVQAPRDRAAAPAASAASAVPREQTRKRSRQVALRSRYRPHVTESRSARKKLRGDLPGVWGNSGKQARSVCG